MCRRYREGPGRGAGDRADRGRRGSSYRERRAVSWCPGISGEVGISESPGSVSRLDLFPDPESVQIVGPGLHHLSTFGQERRPVVGPAVGVPDPLGQLVLDEVGPEAQHLVQNGARHRSEAMRRHPFRRDVQGPERTVLSDLSPDYRRFGRACLDGPSKRPSSRIIGPGADPLIGFNLARRYRQLDRRPFGVGVP